MSVIQAGDLDKNLVLQPNDTVFVPQAPKVFVSGEVRNPGAYGWFPGMTTRQLISVAGGLTPDGSDGRLKVVRQADGKSEEGKIKLDETVKPGDTRRRPPPAVLARRVTGTAAVAAVIRISERKSSATTPKCCLLSAISASISPRSSSSPDRTRGPRDDCAFSGTIPNARNGLAHQDRSRLRRAEV